MTTKREEMVDDLVIKLNMSRNEVESLLTKSSSTLKTIKSIPKTELYQIRNFASSTLFNTFKTISDSLIEKIKKPVVVVQSEIDQFKEDVRYDAIQSFIPSVYKFLKIEDDSERSRTSMSYYNRINSVIDDTFSKIFKPIQ